jgi:hypothetical protein
MPHEAGSVRFKVLSGGSVPQAICNLVLTTGAIMLASDNGHRCKKNGYLFFRYGRYAVSLRTAFEQGELDGVSGVNFAVDIVKLKRRRREKLTAVMIINLDLSQADPADEEDELPCPSDERGAN